MFLAREEVIPLLRENGFVACVKTGFQVNVYLTLQTLLAHLFLCGSSASFPFNCDFLFLAAGSLEWCSHAFQFRDIRGLSVLKISLSAIVGQEGEISLVVCLPSWRAFRVMQLLETLGRSKLFHALWTLRLVFGVYCTQINNASCRGWSIRAQGHLEELVW